MNKPGNVHAINARAINEDLCLAARPPYNNLLIFENLFSNCLQQFVTVNRQQSMSASSYPLARKLRSLVATAMLVLAGLLLITQFPAEGLPADDAVGASLVLAEGGEDDAGRLVDADPPFEAASAAAELAVAHKTSPLAVATHVFSSYLISFIGAPPRAPPSRQLV